MAAKERLQRFYEDRREVYAAVSLGPDNYLFAACQDQQCRYYAVMVHETIVRGAESGGGLVEEEYPTLEEAFITANRWYMNEARKGLG